MKKNISCISKAISFVTGNFVYFVRMSMPVLLLFALAITAAYFALSEGSLVLFSCCLLLAMFAFILLQGIVFGLWDIRQKGLDVELQKGRNVYRVMIQKVESGINPKNVFNNIKYYFSHLKPMFSLTICCIFIYGTLSLIVLTPFITVGVIHNAILQSQIAGDIVNIPDGLVWEFSIVSFIVSLVLLVIIAPSILPFKLRKIECAEEDSEIERIMPKVQ